MYEFPPFFTRQPNEDTWRLQLKLWQDVVYKWCLANNEWRLTPSADVFTNKRIDRTLNIDAATHVLTEMCRKGVAEKLENNETFLVFKHTPADLATELRQWARETGHETSVLTFYELSEGELPSLEKFINADDITLKRVAEVLERRKEGVAMKEEGECVGIKITL